MALTEMAKSTPEAYVGAGAIARKIGAPQNYLGKLLQSLASHGLVESQKGLHGGFRLKRAPEELTLFDVVEPIDHVSRWSGCFLGGGICSEEHPCAVHVRWQEVRTVYLRFLSETTIADLAQRDAREVGAMLGAG
ncbi:Rrf2 family transcriptional regulator [bacterium]|nr:Rrf2 family transcriptional regulator [bacterium]